MKKRQWKPLTNTNLHWQYFSEKKNVTVFNFVISWKTCESENLNFLTFHWLWQHCDLLQNSMTFPQSWRIQHRRWSTPCFPLLHFSYGYGILSIYWFSRFVSYKSHKKCTIVTSDFTHFCFQESNHCIYLFQLHNNL